MKKIITTCLFLFLFFFSVNLVEAQTSGGILNNTALLGGLTTQTAHSANFGDMSLGDVLALIIQIVLGFLGTVFIILMIISGFRLMTAGGNEEQVQKATETIRTAIIGLIIVISAYAITYFVIYYLPFSSTGAENMGTLAPG
ncbi:MAG: hypothetical protein WC863_03615 [Patescibacteria group bacterium]